MKTILCVLGLLAAPVWAGEVAGEVRLPKGEAVPAGAVVLVEVRDVSTADAKAMLMGRREYRDAAGKSVVPFGVSFEDKKFNSANAYAVSCRVTQKGKLLFINDEHVAVLTHGGKTKDVVVPVKKSGS